MPPPTKFLRRAHWLSGGRQRTGWSWDALPASGGCPSSRCTGTRRRRCWPSWDSWRHSRSTPVQNQSKHLMSRAGRPRQGREINNEAVWGNTCGGTRVVADDEPGTRTKLIFIDEQHVRSAKFQAPWLYPTRPWVSLANTKCVSTSPASPFCFCRNTFQK